jgi:hypothetical protein
MNILKNVNKNEKIIIGEASVATAIVLLFNAFAISIPSFWNSIWNGLKIPNEIGQGLIIFLTNIITFAIVFSAVHFLYKCLWVRIIHPYWNVNGAWYVIQRGVTDKAKYFRIGEVQVKQSFYQIHMEATTYNVIFNTHDEENWKQDDTVRTEWEENLLLSDNERLLGLYYAERTNGKPPRQGFHKLRLKKRNDTCENTCDKKLRSKCWRTMGHIVGTLCDVELDSTHDARIGNIELFRSYEKYHAEVVRGCNEISKEYPEVVDKNGIFRSEIQ